MVKDINIIEETIERLKKENKVIPGINDAVFKRIMMNHREYLARIINEFIPLDYETIINELQYIYNELPSDNYMIKLSRTDLLVKVKNYYIQIEANKVLDNNLVLRNDTHFDALCLRIDGDKEKRNFQTKLIQLNFNGKVKTTDIPNLNKKGIVVMQYMDKEEEIIDPRYTKVHLNMEKIKERWYTKSELSWLEKAQSLLLLEDKEEIKGLVRGDEILENVAKSINDYSSISDIINDHLYELIEENYRYNSIERAKIEAAEEGKKEEKLNTARNMLKKDMDINLISELTNLTLAEINALKE